MALYLKTGLPATAMLLFKLYHATDINAIYWLYAGFKAIGYYFGIWAYQGWVCGLLGLMIAFPWWNWSRVWLAGALKT